MWPYCATNLLRLASTEWSWGMMLTSIFKAFVYPNFLSLAPLRSPLVLHYRIITSFHNLPRWIRCVICSNVWLPLIYQVFPLVSKRSYRMGIVFLSSSSQSISHLDRWTNDHIQAHLCYFTLGCQLFLQSCGGLIASCSSLPLSVLYLPALEEWCSLQVRCVNPFFVEWTNSAYPLCKVWHIDGQRYEHYCQISPFYLWLAPCRQERRGKCSSMGKQKHVGLLYWIGDRWVECLNSSLSIAQRKEQTFWSWQHILPFFSSS